MDIKRIWAMANKWTFTIKPIKELLQQEMTQGLWLDPFCGLHSPATITNDLNPEIKATYHLDALDFLKEQEDESADGILFDPPYSPRQVSECYKGFGMTRILLVPHGGSKNDTICTVEIKRKYELD